MVADNHGQLDQLGVLAEGAVRRFAAVDQKRKLQGVLTTWKEQWMGGRRGQQLVLQVENSKEQEVWLDDESVSQYTLSVLSYS